MGEDAAEIGEKARQKGIRKEQEANRIIKRVYRLAERVNWGGNNDLFRFADIVAVRPGWPVGFIQVKTNASINPETYSHPWVSAAIDDENAVYLLWNRIDRFGWEVYRYHDGGLQEALIIDSCDEQDGFEAFREYADAEWGEP